VENLVFEIQQPIEERAAAPAVRKAGTAAQNVLLVLIWLMVGIPLLWGIFKTLQVVQVLFE